MYIALIIVELTLVIISYEQFNRDIFHPSVMSIATIFFGTLFVFPSYDLWRVTISAYTIVVIAIGDLCILTGGLIGRRIRIRTSQGIRFRTKSLALTRDISKVLTAICLLLTVLYFAEAIRVGISYGGSGLGSIGYTKAAYYNDRAGERMIVWIRQGFKIVMCLAYISCFELANNYAKCKKLVQKANINYIVVILCGCFITIASGSRTEMLRIISAVIFDFSVLYKSQHGMDTSNNARSLREIIGKAIPVAMAVVALAFASRSIVKANNTTTSGITSIISYASYYIGSPIQVLNIKLTYYKSLPELLLGNDAVIPKFVYLGRLNYGGNVATIFESLFRMNGLLVTCAYLLLAFILFSYLYYRLLRVNINNELYIVAYSYIYFIFVMAYYSDCISLMLQFSNWITFLLMLVIAYYIPRLRLRHGKCSITTTASKKNQPL